jgi:peptidoglycan/xylan/chitin deacetylase (PgdA/CDA1 family)
VRVALTFDTEFPGRPTVPGVEDQLLAALAAAGVRATFFLQGRWVRANPEQAHRLAAAGHLIANHSNFHTPMDGLDDELLRRDVRKAEETIRTTTGVDPKP